MGGRVRFGTSIIAHLGVSFVTFLSPLLVNSCGLDLLLDWYLHLHSAF
jgi:hypothetical protein